MKHDFDYIIMGSGFGGAVSALRLSEKGYRVLIIEKGKWYAAQDFAKTNWQLRKWFWMPLIRFFGIMKLSIFRHVVILSGTGVGGGSLVYANTLPVPKKAFYQSGSWSKLADWESELKPHYQEALKMMGANKNPKLFDSDLALKKIAEDLHKTEHFEHTEVAVFFGREEERVDDPYFMGRGPQRAGCNFCGGCMTGCRHDAKNTLDKNYLFLAQKLGAKVLAEQEVVDIFPLEDAKGKKGYRITTRSSTRYFRKKKEFTARGVILAGGVLGTIKLLLKIRKKSLPLLSDRLGDHVRTNNETLISVATLDKDKDMSKGIAIGSILHTDENSHLEIVRYSKGSGFWKVLHLPYTTGKSVFIRILRIILAVLKAPLRYFRIYFLSNWAQRTAILLFMQTLDSTLKFRQNIFGKMVSSVSTGKSPSPDIPESIELTRQYSKKVNGKASSFVLEAVAGIPSTAHILGGAVMAEDASHGVINKNNEVFGYENMLIVDGSMISANPGVNPALSIMAIAERAMAQIKAKEKLEEVLMEEKIKNVQS